MGETAEPAVAHVVITAGRRLVGDPQVEDIARSLARHGLEVTVVGLAHGSQRGITQGDGFWHVEVPHRIRLRRGGGGNRVPRWRRLVGLSDQDEVTSARQRGKLRERRTATRIARTKVAVADAPKPIRRALGWLARIYIGTLRRGIAVRRRVERRRVEIGAPQGDADHDAETQPERRADEFELILGPALDELRPDVVHVLDPAAVRVAFDFRIRGAATGQDLYVVADDETACRLPRAQRQGLDVVLDHTASTGDLVTAYGQLLGRDLPSHRTPVQASRPTPLTPPLAKALARVRRLGIGPRNGNGQAWAWSQALQEWYPSVDVEVFGVQFATGRLDMAFPSHHSISIGQWRSLDWQLQWTRYVLENYSHVLVEQALSVLGRLNGRYFFDDLPALASHRIAVGLVFRGSEIRDPRRHAEIEPWSPFRGGEHPLTEKLQTQVDAIRPYVEAFDGPMFVTTVDLLDDVPSATWLPHVLELGTWGGGRPPLRRDRPVVVHAPSKEVMKGSGYVDEVCVPLHEAGRIEYRRLRGVPFEQMPDTLRDADVVLDQFRIGSYGLLASQALASGRVVVGHIREPIRDRIAKLGTEVPIVEATPDDLGEVLSSICAEPDRYRAIAARGPAYVSTYHSGRHSAAVIGRFLGLPDPESNEAVMPAGAHGRARTPETIYLRHRSTKLDRLLRERFGSSSKVTAVDVEPLADVPAVALLPDYFPTARRLADERVDALLAATPSLLRDLVPSLDLVPVLRLALTLRLGIQELPPLIAFLRTHRGPATVVNTMLTTTQLVDVAEAIDAPGGPFTAGHTVRRDLLARHRKALGARRGPPHGTEATSSVPRGSAVVLVGAATERAILTCLAAELGERLPTVLLAKNDRPGTHETIEAIAGPRVTIDAATFAELHIDEEAHGAGTAALVRAEEQLSLSDPAQRHELLDVLAEGLQLLKIASPLDGLVRSREVRVLAGSMDRTVWGPLASTAPVTSIDVQHGAILPFSIADLLSFDLMLAWSQRAERAMHLDGYDPRRRIASVGNAAWEVTDAPCPEHIVAWKDRDRLAVLFPQAAKGPLLTTSSIRRTYESIRATVEALPGWKLLVKLREGASGELEREVLTSPRIRVLTDREAPLRSVLGCADVALSIYSSALADALHAGVPAAIVDLAAVVPIDELDFADRVTVCRDGEDLRRFLGSPPSASPPTSSGSVLGRIRAELAELDLG